MRLAATILDGIDLDREQERFLQRTKHQNDIRLFQNSTPYLSIRWDGRHFQTSVSKSLPPKHFSAEAAEVCSLLK